MGDLTADRIAARATAVGFGLIVFMVTWLIAARTTEHAMVPPESAYAAMIAALIAGAAATVILWRRFVDEADRQDRHIETPRM